MTRLFVDLVRDSLTEDVYNADLAGLSYEIGSTMLGFFVSTSGYNDKQHVLLQLLLRRVKNLEIKDDRLTIMKEHVSTAHPLSPMIILSYIPVETTMGELLPRAELPFVRLLREIHYRRSSIHPERETGRN